MGYVPTGEHRYSGTVDIYFGGVAGINEGSGRVDNCTITENNSNTIGVAAILHSKYGVVYASTNAYMGNVVGDNRGTVQNCQAKRSTFIKNVGSSDSDGANYLYQASLALDTASAHSSLIGKNSGTVNGLIVL